MGKTVLANRWALEDEIANLKGFRKALSSDEDREAFEELMDMCRIFASESSDATNPIVFEPMVMSILLGHQKKLRKLENQLPQLRHLDRTQLFLVHYCSQFLLISLLVKMRA